MRDVKIPVEVLSAIEKALRDNIRGWQLGTYGFLEVTVQPYRGLYSHAYPDGEPVKVRLIKDNYYQQQRDDARAFAACEAAYLEAPE